MKCLLSFMQLSSIIKRAAVGAVQCGRAFGITEVQLFEHWREELYMEAPDTLWGIWPIVLTERCCNKMVFVIDQNKKPLASCHEARARKLLSKGKAAVYLRYPFTIILKRAVTDDVSPCVIKIDPGSRHTGVAVLQEDRVLFMAQIDHKTTIVDDLKKRASYRRRRRTKNCRYRIMRFLNRKKPKGWFPPSIMSALNNSVTVTNRLKKLCPIASIEYELVKFDTQKLTNPDIEGIEYQNGPLHRTNMRSFLCVAHKNTCQYCHGASKDFRIEWEHMMPRSRGGSDSLSNATWACHSCNDIKGNRTPTEWAVDIKKKKKPTKLDNARLEGIENLKKQNYASALADAAKVNAIRWKLKEALEQNAGLPVVISSACHTKVNRIACGLSKDHCVDAACVGKSVPARLVFRTTDCLVITASGRGKHCRTNIDKYGFPKGKPYPRKKDFFGFQSGDMVVANVPDGKKKGRYVGRVSCRSTGSFDIKTNCSRIQGINHIYFKPIQRTDGYNYSTKQIYPYWFDAKLLPPHA